MTPVCSSQEARMRALKSSFIYMLMFSCGKGTKKGRPRVSSPIFGDVTSKNKEKLINRYSISSNVRNFSKVCEWLAKEYVKEVEPDEMICTFIEARFKFSDLLIH